MTIYVAIGHDRHGIKRCWGSSDISAKEAEDQCLASIMEYVRGRPDTGPMDKWRIEFEQK
jgi:hypothetical protein